MRYEKAYQCISDEKVSETMAIKNGTSVMVSGDHFRGFRHENEKQGVVTASHPESNGRGRHYTTYHVMVDGIEMRVPDFDVRPLSEAHYLIC